MPWPRGVTADSGNGKAEDGGGKVEMGNNDVLRNLELAPYRVQVQAKVRPMNNGLALSEIGFCSTVFYSLSGFAFPS